jgi:predicted anti-sigma-YlaC factor YlaD
MGAITDSLCSALRDLAAADARLYRGLATELATPAARPALPADEIAAAIELLERNGYTVTPPRG